MGGWEDVVNMLILYPVVRLLISATDKKRLFGTPWCGLDVLLFTRTWPVTLLPKHHDRLVASPLSLSWAAPFHCCTKLR